MTLRLRIRPPAEADTAAAAEWYEAPREGLGAEFVAVVDAALTEIERAPRKHPLWRAGYPSRRRSIRRFPYTIFCRLDADEIVVVAVAHSRRRPAHWAEP